MVCVIVAGCYYNHCNRSCCWRCNVFVELIVLTPCMLGIIAVVVIVDVVSFCESPSYKGDSRVPKALSQFI